jgi:hypothetical protein
MASPMVSEVLVAELDMLWWLFWKQLQQKALVLAADMAVHDNGRVGSDRVCHWHRCRQMEHGSGTG